MYLTNGGYAVLPPDNDGDATNEIQALSLSNDTLYLTNGGYAVLPQEIDADTTNEIQALTNTPGTISITNGNTITLEDSSAINEIQVLSISNDTLYLTDGGFAVLPQEIDSDTTNEIQTLSYSNDTLSISGGNNVTISSSNFDFIYPDGKTGIQPIYLFAGDTTNTSGTSFQIPYNSYSLLIPFYQRTFIVPTGKNLYITSIYSAYSNLVASDILKINSNLIYRGNGYSGQYKLNMINQPLIIGENDTLVLSPPQYINYNGNNTNAWFYQLYNSSITGFLVNAKVDPVCQNLTNNSFTVPNGKILVILNAKSESYTDKMYINGLTSPVISGNLNYFKEENTNYPSYTQKNYGSALSIPILIDENDVISTPYGITINGYLMDK